MSTRCFLWYFGIWGGGLGLYFCAFFSFFSRDVGGSAKRKTLAFLVGFPRFLPKKARVGQSGCLRRTKAVQHFHDRTIVKRVTDRK